MAPVVHPENANHGIHLPTASADALAAEAALKSKLSRKRTKTGCLTCRKRRIKCGEERPICKNCVKSKRQCEGYNQRVVFKGHAYDYRPAPNGGAHITFRAGPAPAAAELYDYEYGQALVNPYLHSHIDLPAAGQYAPAAHVQQSYGPNGRHDSGFAQLQSPASVGPSHGAQLDVHSNPAQPTRPGLPNRSYHTAQGQHPAPEISAHPQSFARPVDFIPQPGHGMTEWQQPYTVKHDQHWPITFQSGSTPLDKASPASSISSKTLPWSQASAPESTTSSWTPASNVHYQPPPPTIPYLQQQSPVTTMSAAQAQSYAVHQFYGYEDSSPTTFLSQAAVETFDDDYYDVHSDEEMDIDTLAVNTLDSERQRDLDRILKINGISSHEVQDERRYDTFLYSGILDHYRVGDAANPLKNPATARVFAHFISVTGPTLSLFERHPRNTSVLFNEGQIPFSQQGLWTYTMPVAALRHQGLLHSMLALASLHIARLQKASDTPSRQHYAWACKRINRLLGPNSRKRHKATTIAASMLLGFYEILTADHRAWNLHLTGSKQLFLETDFAAMTKQFRRMKSERAARLQLGRDLPSASSYDKSQDEILDQIHDVDERVIGRIVGKEVRYDDHGQVMTPESGMPQELDLSNFEILKDLYWWYLKQDVFQSLVSGNPLLLDFSRWANCPPRAPLGKADAVYGSFDHLVLLLGRIADFASRDRRRKLRQMEANGGYWKPAPGMKAPGAPKQESGNPPTPVSGTNGHSSTPVNVPPQGQGPPQEPLFFGMAPAPKQNVEMPSAYWPTDSMPTPQPTLPEETIDLQAATQAALEEYGRIRAELHAFSQSLGEAFKPLTSEYQVPLETPFGTALFYRSYDIACLWAAYYMALIVAIRSHPHTHPAAHAAAAIASQETAFFANEVGRINAALVPGRPDEPLNPTLGAALSESCMPSFFAAIQYKDLKQRHATAIRIYNIAYRMGWGTMELIANGVETAWVKAAAAGRGPPYTRVVRPDHSDDPRLNGSWEKMDPHGPPDERNEMDRRLINTSADARLTWAIGVLGMEADEK